MLAAAEAALAAQTDRNMETQLVITFGRKSLVLLPFCAVPL